MLKIIEKAIAQTTTNTDIPGGPVNGLTDYVNHILTWALPVIGTLAVLMIIYAGFIYMTSQGNPDRINSAKEIIIGVITGVALLFLTGIILRTIGIL